MWEIRYEKQAQKDLRKLPSLIAERIVEKVKFFADQENPFLFARKIVHQKETVYRFRVGNYRIIFGVAEAGAITILLILTIKHRREIYRI